MLASAVHAEPLPMVVIQPLGPVKRADIRKVKEGIVSLCAVTVEVLPGKPLPDVACYKPRDRYKADDILDVICRQKPAHAQRILPLTARDIPTTTERVEDWGDHGHGPVGWSGVRRFPLPPEEGPCG